MQEVLNGMAVAFKTAKRMNIFWNKANTSSKWKLQVFNAIVSSKILYGLESIQLTQDELNKLDAFQMKFSDECKIHQLMSREPKLTIVS